MLWKMTIKGCTLWANVPVSKKTEGQEKNSSMDQRGGKAAVQMRAWCEGGQPAPLVTELEQNRVTWRSSGYIHWVLWIIRAIFVPSKYRSEFLGELQQCKPAS